jgi:hypothetical protein
LVIALALAACSSSSVPPTTTTTLPSPAASTAAIKQAYTILFDLSNSAVSPKLAVVQDGSVLRSAMTSTLKTGLAKEAGGATTTSVVIEHGAACSDETLPSPCAKVTYNIVSPTGQVLLSHSIGLAVYKDGKWLVAKQTICTLLELANGGSALPGCTG